ncbi:MAG: 50S ribosomal protein L30 [Clostridia bacterium]|nr:50S ribosomal protein L30 [Clostridia bacterium]
MAKLEITLKKSVAGRVIKQKATIEALGLKKIGQTVVHEDNAAIRGMITVVSHMVEVKEVQ